VDRLVEDVYEPWGVRVAATETIEGVVDRGDDPEEPYDLDEGAAREALGRADDLAARYPDHPLVEPMYGPQAVDMVPEAVLEDTVALARERDCRVHVHVAQGRRERLQVQARYGDSSIAVLDRRDLLGPELIAVHCHDAAPDELARLARAGATYVGCPSSIAAIDGAVPPMEEFRRRGVPVGFGTDQAPGPGGHDFLRELRTASLLAKVDAGDPTALPAWHAFAAGTVGGARALGIDDEVGTIEEGKRADVVLLDAGEPGLAPAVADPLETLLPNLVYSASRAAVTDVLVDGAFRVRDGEFVAGDEAAVVETARERATALFDRAADDWRAADSDLVGAADAGWL
jgi:5-methylthioadenosine/S-adenosylhomocysteine deaminase